jgi:hypothetical protein
LAQIKPGQKVTVNGGGAAVTGTVRMVAPTVDAATRNALVYVDLPDTAGRLKAGMFARGEFATGTSTALTLPQTAVLLRDGFSYVFAVGADNRVSQRKVSTGRRSGDRVEILQGLDEKARVVASGGDAGHTVAVDLDDGLGPVVADVEDVPHDPQAVAIGLADQDGELALVGQDLVHLLKRVDAGQLVGAGAGGHHGHRPDRRLDCSGHATPS